MIFDGKTILITGGTGSLGKILVRRILSGEEGTPKKIIVFSRDEAKQHDMRLSFLNCAVSTDEVIYNNFKRVLEFRIGDVRSYADVCSALKSCNIVINAAALKQVPSCEYFPEQAILTNCVGAANIVQAIREHNFNIETAVSISTDKACKPVNTMGMTKAIQERIFIAANILSPETRFIAVRYGNVLASRGSVIPLFHDQIRNGGPITITDPNMTRFLLSLNQAVDTVFNAISRAAPGDIFVPRAPSATVRDIADALVEGRNIDVNVIGSRPGEKMHEIMISEEECHHIQESGDYYVIRPMLPELRDEETDPLLESEYSSENSVIGLEKTKALLAKHQLRVEDNPFPSDGGELLR
jgi:FlaA1/EpsC-like NDP-sugar epimerase